MEIYESTSNTHDDRGLFGDVAVLRLCGGDGRAGAGLEPAADNQLRLLLFRRVAVGVLLPGGGDEVRAVVVLVALSVILLFGVLIIHNTEPAPSREPQERGSVFP